MKKRRRHPAVALTFIYKHLMSSRAVRFYFLLWHEIKRREITTVALDCVCVCLNVGAFGDFSQFFMALATCEFKLKLQIVF